MCNTCLKGYYTDQNGRCAKCPSVAAGPLVLLFVLVVVVAVLTSAYVFHALRGRAKLEHMGPMPGRIPALPRAPSMTLLYCQVVALLGTAKLSWSSTARGAMAVFNSANLDYRLFASECSLRSYWTQYAVNMMVPAGVVAVVALTVLALRSRIPEGQRLVLIEKTLFALGSLSYLPLSRTTLAFFDCSRLPNGAWRLDADLSQPCFERQWNSHLILALLGVICYVFALPILALRQLLKARTRLSHGDVLFRLGGLYNHLRRRYFWVEIVFLAKRLAIVVIVIFCSDVQVLLLVMLMAIFVMAVVAQARLAPYYATLHNRLELLHAASIAFVLSLGNISFADRYPSSGLRVLVDVVIVLVIYSTIGLSFWAIVLDIQVRIRVQKEGGSVADDRVASEALALAWSEAVAEIGAARAAGIAATVQLEREEKGLLTSAPSDVGGIEMDFVSNSSLPVFDIGSEGGTVLGEAAPPSPLLFASSSVDSMLPDAPPPPPDFEPL
eukprot:c11162_g1_i2.p1 GENE.c11162_g1_i2~~c11162_g1_i2.p1  ORF type:complete len:497 (+),score=78.79 c11162_g1_i2:167-1657(+)